MHLCYHAVSYCSPAAYTPEGPDRVCGALAFVGRMLLALTYEDIPPANRGSVLYPPLPSNARQSDRQFDAGTP